MEYENRIREFSTPDKIFRYFATVRVGTVHLGNMLFFPVNALSLFLNKAKLIRIWSINV